jgi:hypothetical protein
MIVTDRTHSAKFHPHRLRILVISVILFFISISLTLLSIEVVLRLVNKYPPQSRYYTGEQENRPSANFVADPDVGWRMRPQHSFVWETEWKENTYISDDQGFRTAFQQPRLMSPSKRIVILGDSFMWGMGVSYEQTIGHHIESSFDRFAVYNLAMPGFGVDQIWQSLHHWALPLDPDLVIVGLYISDFSRSFSTLRRGVGFSKPTYRLEKGRLVEMTPDYHPGRVIRFLERKSRIYSFGRHVEQWIGMNYRVGSWWSLNSAILDMIRFDCEEANTGLLFVYIPNKAGLPFTSLSDYMQENGESYIDLSMVITDQQRQQLYFKQDNHLNAKGYEYVGQLLVRWIEKHMSAHD